MDNQNNKEKDTLHILMDATVEGLLKTVGPIRASIILNKITDLFKDKCEEHILMMKADISKLKGAKVS